MIAIRAIGYFVLFSAAILQSSAVATNIVPFMKG